MQNDNIETRSMLPVGTLLQGGKYRIDRYLSSGGFGNTYVATNTEFEEQVAIKEFFMRGVTQRDGDSVSISVSNETNVGQFVSQKEKFRKEARRLRKLRNNHIVAVHDLFEENGTAYYEMDLIKGESLSERMRRTGQPLTEAEVMSILDQVLDALAVVHAQGLYHLDLKPANIMIDQNGRALLIDFGASKQLSSGESYSVSTSSALAYTPGYAPLEQIDQNIKCFGPWTDIYAFGATLYKLLTNLTPPSPSELISSRSTLNFPMPVSPRMQQLIAWMMKPAFEERPQSIADVKKFLDGSSNDYQMTGENNMPKPSSVYDDETTIITDTQHSKPNISVQGATSMTTPVNNVSQQDAQKKIIVNLLHHPINNAVLTFLLVLIFFCFCGYVALAPDTSYLFGEYAYDKVFKIGGLSLDSLCFIYPFHIFCAIFAIPFIIGINHISKPVSIILTLATILDIYRLYYSWDDLILIYLNLTLYFSCGIYLVICYGGKLKTFALILCAYCFILGLLSIPNGNVIFSDSDFLFSVWALLCIGSQLILVCDMWWMLTRKNHGDSNFAL